MGDIPVNVKMIVELGCVGFASMMLVSILETCGITQIARWLNIITIAGAGILVVSILSQLIDAVSTCFGG